MHHFGWDTWETFGCGRLGHVEACALVTGATRGRLSDMVQLGVAGYIFIIISDGFSGLLSRPTNRSIDRANVACVHSPVRTPLGMEPSCQRRSKHSHVSRLPLRVWSRLTPHEPKRPRAARLMCLSHFPFSLSHFSYRTQSFYDFINYSATVISVILTTVFNHFCYNGQPF
jgi:hypothetical protein